ncbi:MAG: GxxExxY protein [Anaerolineales bacterium]|nr:GxxExxY protein [Anaerolineales bacterium]
MTERNESSVLELCGRIRQIAYDLHVFLGHGHLERVYENGLAHRMRKTGILCMQQYPLQVCDEDGAILGDFRADIFAENYLILEVKACKSLTDEHTAQVLGYLRASKQRDALLVNFGSPKMQIRKFIF